jgi:hypothetical protein
VTKKYPGAREGYEPEFITGLALCDAPRTEISIAASKVRRTNNKLKNANLNRKRNRHGRRGVKK